MPSEPALLATFALSQRLSKRDRTTAEHRWVQETSIIELISSWKTSQNFWLLGILPLCTKNHPVFDLFCVEIQRSPKDLGISIVLPANCEMMARREALRLFPEFKHAFPQMEVYLARYAEIDWDSGRSIVVKQRRLPEVPPCVAAENKRKHPKLPRLEEEEGGVQ